VDLNKQREVEAQNGGHVYIPSMSGRRALNNRGSAWSAIWGPNLRFDYFGAGRQASIWRRAWKGQSKGNTAFPDHRRLQGPRSRSRDKFAILELDFHHGEGQETSRESDLRPIAGPKKTPRSQAPIPAAAQNLTIEDAGRAYRKPRLGQCDGPRSRASACPQGRTKAHALGGGLYGSLRGAKFLDYQKKPAAGRLETAPYALLTKVEKNRKIPIRHFRDCARKAAGPGIHNPSPWVIGFPGSR